MKKLAIVGASALLAALPVVGVFAADTTTVTDSVTITIDETCTLGTDLSGATVNKTMTNGSKEESLEGSKFSISCNDAGGWKLEAVGASEGTSKTAMKGAKGTNSIPTGTSIDGSTSAWAFKAAGTGVETTYSESFASIPDTATKIAGGESPVSENSVDITYGVSVSNEQAADTYTGKVTYTLSHPASD